MSDPVKKTSTPPPSSQNYLRAIPMGGLNEVGMNCCIIESNGSMILIDCGLTFPDTAGFGVDVIFPDLSYVLEHVDILDAVILTHGHEDHIGALPYFLREVDVPVYGGRLTLGMLRRKLEEQGLTGDEVTLHEVEPGDRLQIEGFVVEFIHVNHSIPNAMAVSIETALGRILFTGDWKIDHTPIQEPTTDLQRFAELGRAGVLAVFGDSTNSSVPGFSRSELDVQRGISDVFDVAPGRIIVSQFSSNLHRVQGLLELAVEFDRKVVLQGRSLVNNFGLATQLGFVKVPKGLQTIDVNQLHAFPDDEILIISTGSQAEPRATLTRMAYGDHPKLTIKPTDTILLSARIIPGNEVAIHDMINAMTRRGANVITPRQDQSPTHTSGHGKQEELKMLLNLTRPKYLIPVHGSYHMRKQHADIGKQLKVPHTIVIEDGDVLEFTRDGARVVDRVHVGRIFVDGRNSGSGDIEDLQIRDRKKLAHSGIIVVHAILDLNTGNLTSGPELLQRGFLSDDNDILTQAAQQAAQAVERLSHQARHNPNEVGDAMRNALQRFFRRRLDKKPIIIPLIHAL